MLLVELVLPVGLFLSPAAPVSVSVDPGADRHPISPFVYGVNFGAAAQVPQLRWPLRRWGGNTTTRYSWQDDISNHARDWFFYSIEEANPNPAALPDGSAADRFVDETRAVGGDVLLTVPTIGWTPIDRTRRWGFSVAKYGAQQETECTVTGFPAWCNPDAGNGNRPDGTPIAGNDPHDTSRVIDPSFVTGWMQHIAGRVGTAGAGGVRFFALDNEPELWNSTQRDVHPTPLSYDELWSRTLSYGSAIKAQDPAAQVFGPMPWGWCGYFYSAADGGCAPGADRAAHGGIDILPWYLQQVRSHELATGLRLVDVLDVHYYPDAPGVTLSDDESAATSALRLRSLKSLYDPAYADESWIAQPVQLVPRLKQWIASYLPGAKLSISEYNWGNDGGASSALAQAEALAIFGREGVDYATRWVAPAAGSRVEEAFRLYLDYDGAHSHVAGDSVRAASGDVDNIGSYAVAGGANRLFLLLFNKATASQDAAISFASPHHFRARLFEFDAARAFAPAGAVLPVSGGFTLTLPARSATLAVTTLDFADVPSTSSFYPFVMKLADDGVSAGCGGADFCPGSTVTRAQMAVFLLRSKNGVSFAPPAATGAVFSDVPASAFAAAWIEKLSADGVTAGCGSTKYCPADPVTRAQMAVFLLRTKEGPAYAPPPATGMFGDVPVSGFASAWIEDLARRGITAGCGGGNYCPAASTTRGQMAVFLVTTFALP